MDLVLCKVVESTLQGCTLFSPRPKPAATGEDTRRTAADSLEMKSMTIVEHVAIPNLPGAEMDPLQVGTCRMLLMKFCRE
jgi:hypothetical protein